MNQKYQRELTISLKIAKQATKAILKIYYSKMETKTKDDHTLVTNADILANHIIINGLQKAFPKDGIISEELQDINTKSHRIWYIDPIDGTRSFTEHSDQFAIHIGLTQKNIPIFGIVYKPVSGEYYYAIKSQGAYCISPLGTKTKLATKKNQDYQDLSLTISKDALIIEKWKHIFEALHSKKIMICGSEGLRIMKVAAGITDLHTTETPDKCSTWDICAPHIIAQEAGAYITYIDGTPITYHQQHKLGKQFLVAANKEVAEYARRIIQEKQKG